MASNMITGQVHHVLMTTGRAMTADELADLCIFIQPPSLFHPAHECVLASLRLLVREGLATRRGAKYTGTWNGLTPLPAGQWYTTRLAYTCGNGDRQGPRQPTVEGYPANEGWLLWLADTLGAAP